MVTAGGFTGRLIRPVCRLFVVPAVIFLMDRFATKEGIMVLPTRYIIVLIQQKQFWHVIFMALIIKNGRHIVSLTMATIQYQVEVWTKDPKEGLEEEMSGMTDVEKCNFMSGLRKGQKFKSSDGGVAELLGRDTWTNDWSPTIQENIDAGRIGNIPTNGKMYIYKVGEGHDIGPNYLPYGEMHRFRVFKDKTSLTDKYYCTEDMVNWYSVSENTNQWTYQSTEKFNFEYKESNRVSGGIFGDDTYYVIMDKSAPNGMYYEVKAKGGYAYDGSAITPIHDYSKNADDIEIGTRVYHTFSIQGKSLKTSCQLISHNYKEVSFSLFYYVDSRGLSHKLNITSKTLPANSTANIIT